MYRAAHSVLGGGKERSHQGLSACDVVQETMTRLMNTGMPTDVNQEAFLVTATVRRGIDAVRRMRARPQTLVEHSESVEALLAKDDLEEVVAGAVLTKQVLSHLHVLSDKQRYVFVECVIKERSRTEVALEIGLSRARVGQLASESTRRIVHAINERPHRVPDQGQPVGQGKKSQSPRRPKPPS